MDLVRWLVEQFYQVRQGELLCGGVPVSALAVQYGTPLFIYDRTVLDRKWQLLRTALPPPFLISYSVKANPNRAILRHFLAKGCGLEIASAGEFRQAHTAGCKGPGRERPRRNLSWQSLKALERFTWNLCWKSSGSLPSVAG